MTTRIGSLMTRGLILAALYGVQTTAARAAPPSTDAPVDALPLELNRTEPDWLKPPSGDDIAREYPRLAQWMQLGGEAVITCRVQIDGHLDDCRIDSDAPAGLGFGAAAVRAAASWRMKPATLDGQPVVGVATVPLQFRMEAASPPPPVALAGAPVASLALARQIASLEDWRQRAMVAAQPMLDGLDAEVVAGAQPQDALKAVDALRQGAEDAITEDVERRVHDWAARLSEADLKSIVGFYQSPAGRAWIAAQRQSDASVNKVTFAADLAGDARTHFCAQVACSGVPQTPMARPRTP